MNKENKLKLIINDIAEYMIEDLNNILEPVNFLEYIYDEHMRIDDELNMINIFWDYEYDGDTLGDIALELNMDEYDAREKLYDEINNILSIEID